MITTDEFVESLGERAKLPLTVTQEEWHKAWMEVCQQYTDLRNKHEGFRGRAHQELKMAAATLDAARAELCLRAPEHVFEEERAQTMKMIDRIRYVADEVRALVSFIERTS